MKGRKIGVTKYLDEYIDIKTQEISFTRKKYFVNCIITRIVIYLTTKGLVKDFWMVG